MEERAVGFAGRACYATKKELELRRTLMYFSFFLGLSVRCLVYEIFTSQKKMKSE
jgi:hypothetical protein